MVFTLYKLEDIISLTHTYVKTDLYRQSNKLDF
jgi:hypothetical protein